MSLSAAFNMAAGLGNQPKQPFPVPRSGRRSAVAGKRTAEKGTTPFSIRLTFAERQALEAAAGSIPLGSYIRGRILDGGPGRRSQRRPVADQDALGRVLGQLGQSRLASNLNQLAKAANMGALSVTPEVEAELRDACEHVRAMRLALMRALGLQEGPPW